MGAPRPEPRVVTVARTIRLIFDLLAVVIAFVVLLGLLLAMAVGWVVRDPALIALVSGGLMALGGLSVRNARKDRDDDA